MKEFDISDKELKSLLQSEGLESPSADFNNRVLSNIASSKSEKTEPVKAPKWILLLMGFMFIAPTVYFIFYGDPSVLEERSISIPLFDAGISAKSILTVICAMIATGMALLFSRMLKQQSTDRARVKKG